MTEQDEVILGWLRWNDGDGLNIVKAMKLPQTTEEAGQEFLAFSMRVLADAIEDAGCCDPYVLAALRGGGSPARPVEGDQGLYKRLLELACLIQAGNDVFAKPDETVEAIDGPARDIGPGYDEEGGEWLRTIRSVKT